MATEFADGVWYVDLAPITDPEWCRSRWRARWACPISPAARRWTTLLRFVGDRRMLMVLDNCEHLLDASAALAVALLGACPALTLLDDQPRADRRPGRGDLAGAVAVTGRRGDRAVHRPRAARPGPTSRVTDDNADAVTEICRRLDGMPLAIELAAARVRALSLTEILDSLHDRFRLLTGGARTAVRRQQTLRASVDWSHALLTEPERVLFRRLAVFLGGFDLEAAQAVAGGGEVERYQVLDQLTLLVDKSLVVAEDSGGRTRYRLLETVRQYALEKLGESGEGRRGRGRHRDHYTAMAAELDAPPTPGTGASGAGGNRDRQPQKRFRVESRERRHRSPRCSSPASLQPLWLSRWRIREGLAWLDAALAAAPECYRPYLARVRALADKALQLPRGSPRVRRRRRGAPPGPRDRGPGPGHAGPRRARERLRLRLRGGRGRLSRRRADSPAN